MYQKTVPSGTSKSDMNLYQKISLKKCVLHFQIVQIHIHVYHRNFGHRDNQLFIKTNFDYDVHYIVNSYFLECQYQSVLQDPFSLHLQAAAFGNGFQNGLCRHTLLTQVHKGIQMFESISKLLGKKIRINYKMDNEIILNRKKNYVSFILNCDFRYSFLCER